MSVTAETPPKPDAALAQVVAAYLKHFHQLRKRWDEETLCTSSMTEIVGHPAYREIISMGWAVVPIILQELRERPAWWFGALQRITGADPTKPEHLGRLELLAEDWLRWGEENGLV